MFMISVVAFKLQFKIVQEERNWKGDNCRHHVECSAVILMERAASQTCFLVICLFLSVPSCLCTLLIFLNWLSIYITQTLQLFLQSCSCSIASSIVITKSDLCVVLIAMASRNTRTHPGFGGRFIYIDGHPIGSLKNSRP